MHYTKSSHANYVVSSKFETDIFQAHSRGVEGGEPEVDAVGPQEAKSAGNEHGRTTVRMSDSI